MTVTPKRKRNPARRGELLDVATRLFGERGFNGVTVQAVAKEGGVSNAGLLYYFGSKDELLLAVLDQHETRETAATLPHIEAIKAAGDDAARSWKALMALLRRIVEAYQQDPDVGRFILMLQVEALDQRHPAHGWFQKREQLTLEMLDAILKPHVVDPWSNAGMIVSMIHGLAQHWIRQDMAFNLLDEWDKAAEMIVPRGKIRPHGRRTAGAKASSNR